MNPTTENQTETTSAEPQPQTATPIVIDASNVINKNKRPKKAKADKPKKVTIPKAQRVAGLEGVVAAGADEVEINPALFTEKEDKPKTKSKKPGQTGEFPIAPERLALRMLLKYFYAHQRTRVAMKNRATSVKEGGQLDPEHQSFFARHAAAHAGVEQETLKEIARLSSMFKINDWLRAQPGVGPTIAAIIMSEIDINRARHVSSLWKLAGLDVVDGKAPRPVKGQILAYNSFLRTKLVGVMADSILRHKGFLDSQISTIEKMLVDPKAELTPADYPALEAKLEKLRANYPKDLWANIYYNYRVRYATTKMLCGLCKGTGITPKPSKEDTEFESFGESGEATEKPTQKVGSTCYNCNGKPNEAPWGRSDAHRDRAAKRVMVKLFLQKLWLEWRKLEGLTVSEPYAVAKLHHKPHGQ